MGCVLRTTPFPQYLIYDIYSPRNMIEYWICSFKRFWDPEVWRHWNHWTILGNRIFFRLWQIALNQHVTQIDIPATITEGILHEVMPQRTSAEHGTFLLIEGNDVPTGTQLLYQSYQRSSKNFKKEAVSTMQVILNIRISRRTHQDKQEPTTPGMWEQSSCRMDATATANVDESQVLQDRPGCVTR